MKLLTKKDLANITKRYSLNSEEVEELTYYSNTLNLEQREKPDYSETQFELFNTIGYKPSEATKTAIISVILYLGKRIQQRKIYNNETMGKVCNFNSLVLDLSELIGVGYNDTKRLLKGLIFNPRFNKTFDISDACGLNFIEIY